MALIKCKECGKDISDQAASCPNCGAPTAKTIPKKEQKTSPITWAAAIAIIVGLVWYAQSRDYKEHNLPVLPIEVKFRNAILGSGMVLQVQNTSSKPLMILVTLSNPTTQQKKVSRLDILPNSAGEIGHMEGWILASGDQIEVSNANFKTWKGSIP